jgi:phosphoribosylglycinamide formyltransferase-1
MKSIKVTTSNMVRLAILISGGGTTMDAIVRASMKNGPLFGKILPVVVVVDRICEGLAKAQKLDIPTLVANRPLSSDGKELLEIIDTYYPDVVSQNGWLSKTPLPIIKKFKGNIYNQHPAPLDPEHKDHLGRHLHFGGKGIFGKAAHASVLEFQRLSARSFPTEASIHRVAEQFDEGQVVARRAVHIRQGDTAESLARRMLPIEHDLQIEFLKKVYERRVKALVRKKPLIRTSEEQFLEKAKMIAMMTYPHG